MNATQTTNKKNSFDLYPERFVQVENGTKTATLRNGNVDCKKGTCSIVNSSTKKELKVNVTKVVSCKLVDLTQEMLTKNNYATYEEAKKVMTGLYPNTNDNSVVTHIEFTVVK